MPVRIQIDTAELQTFAKKLPQVSAAQLRELGREFDLQLLERLRESKTEPPRVPVDTGALQSSGFTEPAAIRGGVVESAIQYGGIAAAPFNEVVDYAAIVHEAAGRNFRRPGSGAKFVETHIERTKGEMQEAFGRALQRAIDESVR